MDLSNKELTDLGQKLIREAIERRLGDRKMQVGDICRGAFDDYTGGRDPRHEIVRHLLLVMKDAGHVQNVDNDYWWKLTAKRTNERLARSLG